MDESHDLVQLSALMRSSSGSRGKGAMPSPALLKLVKKKMATMHRRRFRKLCAPPPDKFQLSGTEDLVSGRGQTKHYLALICRSHQKTLPVFCQSQFKFLVSDLKKHTLFD